MINRIINSIANGLGLMNEEVTPASTFNDLQMDSLDKVEMVMGLEDDLGVQIDDAICGEWASVADVLNYFKERKGARYYSRCCAPPRKSHKSHKGGLTAELTNTTCTGASRD